MLYMLHGGIAWRALHHEFPPWQTVYHDLWVWWDGGTREHIKAAPRELGRVRDSREARPSGAVIESQATKTTETGGPRGDDGGKKVHGRKRHILADTTGLLKVHLPGADVQDRDDAKLLLALLGTLFPRLAMLWADAGYQGPCAA